MFKTMTGKVELTLLPTDQPEIEIVGDPYVHGSISKLSLNKIPFDVDSEADFEEQLNQWVNELVSTSGRAYVSSKKVIQEITGVTVVTSIAGKETLRSLVDRRSSFPISFEYANGSVCRFNGQIKIGG